MSDSSSTKAFAFKSAPKHFNLKSKFPAPESSAPSSAPNDDLLSRIAIDTRNSVSSGLSHVIDFQGNILPVFMAITLYIGTNYDTLAFKNHSKLSPASLTGYCLALVYIYYLLNDLYVRPSPSKFTDFMNTPEYMELLAQFKSLPVPSFMLKFFQAAAPTSDPRRPNINFIPSFACFDFTHDFGKYLPVSIFFQSHDYVLAKKMNEPAEDLFSKLLDIKFFGNYYIGQLFGANLSDGTANFSYASQLAQAFEGIVSPALARARSQKTVYARINFHVQTPPASVDNTNPYRFLLPLDDDNASEFGTFLTQLSDSIGSSFGSTTPMMNVISSLSGTNILIHGYSDYAIPTWHTVTHARHDTATPIPAKLYATKIHFLTNATNTTGGTRPFPADPTTIDTNFYLVKSTTPTAHYPTTSDVVKFRPRHSAAPAVRILDPYDYNATTFKQAYLSGAFIESLEIDGSGIPLPNADMTLDEENSQFLQSAIPMSTVRRATNYLGTAASALWAERRRPDESGRQKATTLLYDMTENRLGTVTKTVPANHATIAGFTLRNFIGNWLSGISRIGFLSPTSDNDEKNRLPDLDKGKIVLWSPYRFDAGRFSNMQADGTRHVNPDRTYMLSNLRTLFGTNPPLGETPYYLEAIPVA